MRTSDTSIEDKKKEHHSIKTAVLKEKMEAIDTVKSRIKETGFLLLA